MTWEEVHEEIIQKLLEHSHGMLHSNFGIVPGHDCAPRACVWIIKAPNPHVSFVNGIAEVSPWYDDFNGMKISLADPDAFEKIKKEVWQIAP
jgi:hypothetical protein